MFHLATLRPLSILAALLLTAVTVFATSWRNLPNGWRKQSGDPAGAEAPEFDDSAWSATPGPPFGPAGAAGPTAWYRLRFPLPAETCGHGLFLRLGASDSKADVYFNGVKLAGGRDPEGRAVAVIPALLLRAGSPNVVAIRVPAGASLDPSSDSTWVPVSSEIPAILEQAREKSTRLAEACAGLGPSAGDFLLKGLSADDFARLGHDWAIEPSDFLACTIAADWRELCRLDEHLEQRLREVALYRKGDLLGFMRNQELYLVPDFEGDALRRPALGSEFSDFGSWYDIAYSGGPNRFFIGSVRQGVGPGNEFFNTPRDVAQLALFLVGADGGLVGADDGTSTVTWYPYGWRTSTRQAGIELDSATFFSGFNTMTIYGRVRNSSATAVELRPALLITARSSYGDSSGGRVIGRVGKNATLTLVNTRTGPNTSQPLYTDALAARSANGPSAAAFAPHYYPGARGPELAAAVGAASAAAIDGSEGSAVLESAPLALKPGESREFSFVVAASDTADAATRSCGEASRTSPAASLARVEEDWNGFLAGLPALAKPGYAAAKLYYSSAIALRKNHWIMTQDGRRTDASFPARGGFNYFYQSDSCWNLLGYLDFHPEWARGHARPILVPPCEIMDPHFFWSMWELYSRLPDPVERRAFAGEVYPLLQEAYRVWTTKLDIDGDLLVATPDNWDDNPRYDLIFKEVKYAPGWNSWWNDLVACCRDHALDDPAPSSQLGYGAVVLERFARILGRDSEADAWGKRVLLHRRAVDTLWDEKRGYWIVTYRGTLRDEVLTSSIVYPIFTDLCRDPARIRRVVGQHLLNPAEFAGEFPVPTVAYDDPRFYHQKPPFQDEAGGLWRGNIWMPETWIIVKGLFKYGYEREAEAFAARLLDMMARQADSVGEWPQMRFSPAEWYDARTGLAQNNRAFSWSSAVALDYLLGNYQNERVLGANPERDGAVNGHVRELFDFATGRSLFRVEATKTVFPVLAMRSMDNAPIQQSRRVEFAFSDPAGNFAGAPIRFSVDEARWNVVDASTGRTPDRDSSGCYSAPQGRQFLLLGRD
jgi:hypothetical protein